MTQAGSNGNGNGNSNGTDELTVATLGPLGTYSHQAARAFFSDREDASISLKDTIRDIFEAVQAGTATYGVCPLENSTNGPVQETQECLKAYGITSLKTRKLRIGHALLRSRESAINAPVQRIYSHEQALGQCRNYIAARYPQAALQTTNSTALAAKLARSEPDCLAISSLLCAEIYGLQIVDREIQDGRANETTFMIFVRQK